MADNDGLSREENVFALIFATNICWSRQSGAGSRQKRLVYFARQRYVGSKMASFNQFDEQLRALCVIDEQHRFHREYGIMIRCHSCRDGDVTVMGSGAQNTQKSPELSRPAAPLDKLSQYRAIESVKANYNLPPPATDPDKCLLDQWQNEKKVPPPLYFDDVVRLLQIYANIQPSGGLIKALERKSLFSYTRIVLMSESEVMSLLNCLRLWIIPLDLADSCLPSLAERITGQMNKERGSTVPIAAPATKPKRKAWQRQDDRAGIVAPENDQPPALPEVIASKKKWRTDNERWPFSSSDGRELSVYGACSKLKNQCIEQMDKDNVF